ncbi:MAG: hypothetical protein OQL16_14410 [Gammaproteobacteria bacterium]|nr:hypothetical protein [Gammaproteobacteria bacterium]
MTRLLIISLLLALLTACSQPPVEEAIRNNMQIIQTAIEEKDRSEVLSYLTEDFTGNQHINKEEAGKMLIAKFLLHNKITITVLKTEITPHPGYNFVANGKHSVVVTGADRLVPDSARVYEVKSHWELKDDDWMLARLTWE